MQSGISASKELHTAFQELVSNDSQRGLLVTIDKESLVPSTVLGPSSSSFVSDLSLLKPHVNPKTALYIILRRYPSSENAPFVAVTYVPDSAHVRQKMLFASTRLTLVRELGIERFRETIFATKEEELTEEGFKKHDKHTALEAPLTEEEVSLGEVKRKEAEEGRGMAERKSHVSSGVSMPVTDEALTALKALGSSGEGGDNLVQLKINIPTETMELASTTNIPISTLSKTISSTEPRYSFYRFNHSHNGETSSPILFIYTCPTGSKIKERMLYAASSRSAQQIAEAEGGLKIEKKIEASNPDETATKQTYVRPYFVSPFRLSLDTTRRVSPSFGPLGIEKDEVLQRLSSNIYLGGRPGPRFVTDEDKVKDPFNYFEEYFFEPHAIKKRDGKDFKQYISELLQEYTNPHPWGEHIDGTIPRYREISSIYYDEKANQWTVAFRDENFLSASHFMENWPDALHEVFEFEPIALDEVRYEPSESTKAKIASDAEWKAKNTSFRNKRPYYYFAPEVRDPYHRFDEYLLEPHAMQKRGGQSFKQFVTALMKQYTSTILNTVSVSDPENRKFSDYGEYIEGAIPRFIELTSIVYEEKQNQWVIYVRTERSDYLDEAEKSQGRPLSEKVGYSPILFDEIKYVESEATKKEKERMMDENRKRQDEELWRAIRNLATAKEIEEMVKEKAEKREAKEKARWEAKREERKQAGELDEVSKIENKRLEAMNEREGKAEKSAEGDEENEEATEKEKGVAKVLGVGQ